MSVVNISARPIVFPPASASASYNDNYYQFNYERDLPLLQAILLQY